MCGLLDVRTAEKGGSCVHGEGHEQSVLVLHFMSGAYSITVQTLPLPALASFPAPQ